MKYWEDAARLPRIQLSRREWKCQCISTQSFFNLSALLHFSHPSFTFQLGFTLNRPALIESAVLSFCVLVFAGFNLFLFQYCNITLATLNGVDPLLVFSDILKCRHVPFPAELFLVPLFCSAVVCNLGFILPN